MRFVVPLSELEKETLNELFKNHPQHRTRMRGHMILLSAEKFSINEIARIYKVQRDTVSRCIQHWKAKASLACLIAQKAVVHAPCHLKKSSKLSNSSKKTLVQSNEPKVV